MMALTANRLRANWAVAFFLVACLIPGHLFGWAVEWGFVVAATVAGIVLFHEFSHRFGRVARGGLLAVGLLMLIASASYVRTAIDGRFDTGMRDFIDIVKPLLIFFSCVAGLSFGQPSLLAIRRACLAVLIYAIVCFAIIYFDVPGLSPLTSWLYADTKTNISQFVIRLSFPFENPNFLGFFSVLSLIISLNFGAKPHIPLVLCSITCAALSGSRTAWITSAFVLAVLVFDHAWRALRHWQLPSLRSLVLSAALLAAAFLILPDLIESYKRLSDLIGMVTNFDLARDGSYAERIALRARAVELIIERPWLGWGAIKYTELEVVDNQYYAFVLRYGFFGLALLAASFLCLFMRFRRFFADRIAYLVPSVLLWFVIVGWFWNGNFAENIRMCIIMTMLVVATTTEVRDDE